MNDRITVRDAHAAAGLLGLPNVVLIQVDPASGAAQVATWGKTAADKLAAARYADLIGQKVVGKPGEVHEDFRLLSSAQTKERFDAIRVALLETLTWAELPGGANQIPLAVVRKLRDALAILDAPIR